jgi:hypothetical protein
LPSQFPFLCIRVIREIGGGKSPNNFEANRQKKSPLLHEGFLPRQEAGNESDKPMKMRPIPPTAPKAVDLSESQRGQGLSCNIKTNPKPES